MLRELLTPDIQGVKSISSLCGVKVSKMHVFGICCHKGEKWVKKRRMTSDE